MKYTWRGHGESLNNLSAPSGPSDKGGADFLSTFNYPEPSSDLKDSM